MTPETRERIQRMIALYHRHAESRLSDRVTKLAEANAAALEELLKDAECLRDTVEGLRLITTSRGREAEYWEAESHRLRETLVKTKNLLSECSQDYNSPYFTDRHGTGPRISALLVELRGTLSSEQGT